MDNELRINKVHVPTEYLMIPLGGAALRLLGVLLKFANKSLLAWPKRETILKYLPDHDVRHLKRAVQALVRFGVLRVDLRPDPDNGNRLRTYYQLIIPSVKKILALYRRETHAGPGAKKCRSQVPKSVVPPAAYRNELKPCKLEDRPMGPPAKAPTRSVDRSKSRAKTRTGEDAIKALEFFRALFFRHKGREMVEWKYHVGIMDDLVGGIGLPAAKAAAEAWFKKGGWSRFATEDAHHSIEGFQRCIEQIQDSDAYESAKSRFAREESEW